MTQTPSSSSTRGRRASSSRCSATRRARRSCCAARSRASAPRRASSPRRPRARPSASARGQAQARSTTRRGRAFCWASCAASLARARCSRSGHRVVHGGTAYRRAGARRRRDDRCADPALVPLAPLHQPHNLAPIRAIAARAPALPQVACFDTAFHRDQPALAQAFALPPEITERGVRRYGFHGLSYEYVAGVLPAIDARAAAGRVVVAHLGNGASMCALRRGRSVASTMGFTALDGLMMGTRAGALDPGVLLYLMDETGLDARALEKLLYHRSGLLGVSGLSSSDMRTLLASDDAAREVRRRALLLPRRARAGLARRGARRARRAGVHGRHRRARGAGPRARSSTARRWLGLAARRRAPTAGRADRRCRRRAGARPYVVPTDEELMIARHYAVRRTGSDRDMSDAASRRTRWARSACPRTACGARRRSARSTTSRSASPRFRWGRPVIRAFGLVKQAAARANAELGVLPADKARADRARRAGSHRRQARTTSSRWSCSRPARERSRT